MGGQPYSGHDPTAQWATQGGGMGKGAPPTWGGGGGGRMYGQPQMHGGAPGQVSPLLAQLQQQMQTKGAPPTMQGGSSGLQTWNAPGETAPRAAPTPPLGNWATALNKQIQGAAGTPGQAGLIQQAQAGDQGRAYNDAMRAAGFTISPGSGEQFTYAQRPPSAFTSVQPFSGWPHPWGGYGSGWYGK